MTAPTLRLTALLIATCLVSACGKSEAPSAPDVSNPEAPKPEAPKTEPTKPEPAKPEPAKPEPEAAKPEPSAEEDTADTTTEALRTQANELLTRWLTAQNEGDFARYAALYAADFKGVRRTSTGAPKEFDLEGWKADRAKMFERKMEVAADGITISADTTPGVTVVTFTQRWRSGNYADHGQKVVKLRAAENGELRIVVEDMRTSSSGWEDARVKAADLTRMTPPLTVSVSVDRVLPKDFVGDCMSGNLEIVIEDSTGRKETISPGIVTGMAGDANGKTRLLPSARGRYQDLGAFCGGLKSGWRVEKDGDFIIGTDIWEDEMTGAGRQRWVLANLPAGADVRLQ
jgi:hypothetical protein